MAENNVMIASAVLIPEDTEESILTATGATKRRQSFTGALAGDDKRPRLSLGADGTESLTQYGSPDAAESRKPSAAVDGAMPDTSITGSRSSVRQTDGQGRDEERKRGKRLFGALLGTLSQSSQQSATKQKRRADIERKQKEKLRVQAEEYDEERRRQLDELAASRRNEQAVWDEESIRIRHANLLATAQFLKTKTSPMLHYKPWDLTAEEKERIEVQVLDANRQIAEELGEQKGPAVTEAEGATALEAGGHRVQGDDTEDVKSVAQTPAGSAATEAAVPAGDVDGKAQEDGESVAKGDVAAGETEEKDRVADEESEEMIGDAAKDAVDDNEEVVVEAGEDAVIW